MPSVEDLGKLVKEKYPTEAYWSMSDADLGRAVKAKFPGTAYDKFEDVPSGGLSSTTPTGLSSIASPPVPDESAPPTLQAASPMVAPAAPVTPPTPPPGTLKGVGQHIVGSAVASVPEIGLQAGKLLLSAVALPEKVIWGETDEYTQAGFDWINDKQAKIAAYFDSTYTAPDVNVSLGPLGQIGVGSTIGGIIPFAAGGAISAAGKAAKALDVAVPVYEAVAKAMAHGALFSTVYEVPNVIASKTWKEAEEKAKQAGVSITLSALMAGTFTGTAKGFSWAKEKMGKTPAERVARAQVMAEENGVPNTEKLGAEQPTVTAVDEVYAKVTEEKVQAKKARLEENVPKVESVDDKIRVLEANEAKGAAERARLGIEEKHNAPIEEPPISADQPPVPKQLDVEARKAENLQNLTADPNSPGMKAWGSHIAKYEKLLRLAKNPTDKAAYQAEIDGAKASVLRINERLAGKLAGEQVQNAVAAIPQEVSSRVDKSGKGSPTAPPQPPVDQEGPMKRMADAAIELGRDAQKAKELAHMETTAAELDPTLQGLAKERVVKLRKLGEEFLGDVQKWLVDLQRSVNPISMLATNAQQAFVNFEGRRTEFGMLMNNALKRVNELLPEKLDREFVTLARDPAGHPEILKVKRSERINAALGMVDKFYDTIFKIGVDADIFDPKQAITNFVNRIYSASDAKKIFKIMEAQPLDAKNKHSFRRVYQTMEEAAQRHKIYPATLDITELMRDYGNSLMRTMSNGQLVRDMIKVMGNDLMWTAEVPRDPRWRAIDERITSARRETRLPDGKIQVEKLYADEGIHKLLSSALDPNPLKGTRLGQIADLNTRYKSMMLMFDVYHMVNLARQRAAMNLYARGERLLGKKDAAILSYKEGLAMFDPENPKFEVLRMVVRNGLGMERADWQKLMTLSVDDIKRSKASAVGELWEKHGIPKFNEYMWEKVHKGLKAATAVAKYEEMLRNPELLKTFTHDQLARKAAIFANDVFGGQSWSTHGRTAKFNAISRMILLAPDWFETRMNLAAGLGKIREGGEFKATPEFQMAAKYWAGYMAQMSLAAFTANTILEKAFPDLKDHPMKKGWRGMTNIVMPNKDRSGHNLILGLGGTYQYVFDMLNDAGRTLTNREAVLFRAASEFATQRDWTGKLTGPTLLSEGNLVHLGKNLIPFPLTFRLFDLEFNAAGVANTKTGIDVVRTALRSLGTHPTTGYPMDLRREAEALMDRREVVRHKMIVLAQDGKTAMARREVEIFNNKVVELAKRSQKVYRGGEVAKLLERILITK